MRLSYHLLAIAATLVLASGNALSMDTDVDQNMALEVKSSHAVRSLGAGQTEDDKGKDYLRSLKTTAETNGGNGDGEEERRIISSLKKLFPSSATKKAAAAAKQAELDNLITTLVRDDNLLYAMFHQWAIKKVDSTKIFLKYNGEFNDDARKIANCASLQIHTQRCRSLYPNTEEEENAAEEKVAKPRKKEIRPLVDLCLRFVTKHFESICMEKIVAFPEEEAALIASMPSNLVHRMVINLVKESKRVKKKNRESRAQIETLERSLRSTRRGAALLESARDGEAAMRTRMGEQQHIAQRLERELDTVKTELATAEAENRQLRSKVDNAERSQLRLEAKVSTML
ncbi:hypothetical protein BBP00_00009689 [Phytophthora kernoviae]|uniref:RxLR effector protein n=1 Tax=Phytophthora kernoviae TaxID=325452 RepID=A0A3F2RC05_9STRA|nr:hypothetical protein BBP00_00009689 [Phytophthora kernoviae]